jgi:hypothetical protein
VRRRPSRWLAASVLALATAGPPGFARADDPAGSAEGEKGDLRAHVRDLEARVARLERKLRLLGSEDGGFAEGLSSPAFLRDQAHAIIRGAPKQLSLEGARAAYRRLALLRQLHPESDEAASEFPLAALLFKRIWFQSRYAEPDSLWMSAEPVFMFHWLSSFFGDDAFPQEQAEALLLGMPYPFFVDFQQYAKSPSRPRLSRWRVRAEEDNGTVRSLRAEPVDEDA